MTATSFSGGRPGFRRTHYLAFTVLRSIAIERKVLGGHIDVQVEAYDETNTVIDVKGIAARIVASGNTGIVCLVGVQSNQYPRALDLARKFRALGVPVLGFTGDTPETIERDIRIIQRELPVDMLEFFCLTPLPGSQDHNELYEKGVWMDPDMNKYDLEHVVTGHDTMSKAEWEGIYDRAWHLSYSWEHIETLIKRALATGIKPARLAVMIFNFYACYLYERVHPLQSGVFRRKIRGGPP